MHNNRPDVDAKVEEHNCEETDLRATTLTDALEVKYEAQTEAADDAEERRDEGRESAGADAEVGTEVRRPCTANALSANVHVSICPEVDEPVEERPQGPESRQQDQLRGHCDLDLLKLLLGANLLGYQDTRSIRAYDSFKRRDEKSERQGHAFDNQKGDIGIWCYASDDTLFVVLRQTVGQVSAIAVWVSHSENSLDSTTNQLSQVPSNDPNRQVFATRSGWRKRHDSARLGDIPSTGTDTSEEAT